MSVARDVRAQEGDWPEAGPCAQALGLQQPEEEVSDELPSVLCPLLQKAGVPVTLLS